VIGLVYLAAFWGLCTEPESELGWSLRLFFFFGGAVEDCPVTDSPDADVDVVVEVAVSVRGVYQHISSLVMICDTPSQGILPPFFVPSTSQFLASNSTVSAR
jgi:hypothetical protein